MLRYRMMMKAVMVTVTLLARMPGSAGGLLGAGEGEGSCAAAPFRAHHVQWTYGCPAFAPCCSEFGYCRPLVRKTAATGHQPVCL